MRLGELDPALSDHAGVEGTSTEAIAAFGEPLTRAPDSVLAQNKGSALLSLGKLRATLDDHAGAGGAYTQRIAAYGEALSLAPDDVMARIALKMVGELRATLSDQAGAEGACIQAITATNEALRRAPGHLSALCNQGGLLCKLAGLQWQRGDESGACPRLQEAQTLLDAP